MKKTAALMAAILAIGLTAGMDAEAKRLGGGRSAGMQRQAVTAPAGGAAPAATPPTPGQAAPAAGTAAAAATAPAATAAAGTAARRSWLGPVAGIAAGLGLAALASHFGLGEALANMLTLALLAMAVMALVGYLMRRRGAGPAAALAGAAGSTRPGAMDARRGPVEDVVFRTPAQPEGGSLIGARLPGGALAAASTAGVGQIPAGFDTAAFERTAREQFLRLQAANDAGDLARLRDLLSPEMFGIVQGEIAGRGGLPQATEVFGLGAQVLDVAEDAGHYIVSVRFTGSIREQPGALPEDLDEVWHLAKPRTGTAGWVVAGIQQAA